MEFASALGPVTRQTSALAPPPIASVISESQIARNWCWLATTVSVARAYGSVASQCDLANTLLGEVTCCGDEHSLACNRTGVVERALKEVNHHDSTESLVGGSPAPLVKVQNELAAARPPVSQFGFNGGNSHVVVLAGYGVDAAGDPLVRIGDPDPYWSSTDLVWSQAHLYRGGVQWTHVCWTRP